MTTLMVKTASIGHFGVIFLTILTINNNFSQAPARGVIRRFSDWNQWPAQARGTFRYHRIHPERGSFAQDHPACLKAGLSAADPFRCALWCGACVPQAALEDGNMAMVGLCCRYRAPSLICATLRRSSWRHAQAIWRLFGPWNSS